MRLSTAFHPAPLLWLAVVTALCLLHPRGAAAQPGPVISSLSGCVDVGATTLNCSLPVLLTVRGLGFLTGVAAAGPLYQGSPTFYINPQPQFSPQAVQAGWTRPYGKAAYGTPCNDSHFEFWLINLGQGVLLTDTLISLTAMLSADNPSVELYSEPFLGLSIASTPQPDIAGISGCPVTAADGSSTSACLPDRHLLTVTGSGFLSWAMTPLQLLIGATSNKLYFQLSPTSIQNDSCALIDISVIYRQLLLVRDFGAPPQTFAIRESVTGWTSRALHIQFDALPPPSIISVSPVTSNVVPACQWGPNRTSLVDCTAGGSVVQIRGRYLYEVTVTIGGQPCTLPARGQQDTLYATLTTPLYSYQPGVLYDLTLTSPAGTVTLLNFISFSSAPAIVSAACRDPTLPIDIGSVGCQVGETLLLNGINLPPSSTPFAVTIYSFKSRSNASCANPRWASSTQLACDLMTPGLPAIGGWDAQYISFANGLTLSITGRYDAWDQPYAPRISGVSSNGCGSPVNSADRTLSGCMGGELLTFYGSHFRSEVYSMMIQPMTVDPYAIVNFPSQATTCLGFDVLDDGTAVCEMPRPASTPLLPYGTPMMMFMYNATSLDRSNALLFTIASSSTAPASSSSSSLSTAVQVALGVVLGLLGLMGVVGLIVVLRRRQAKSHAGPRSDVEDGGRKERKDSSWFQLSELQEQSCRSRAEAAGRPCLEKTVNSMRVI